MLQNRVCTFEWIIRFNLCVCFFFSCVSSAIGADVKYHHSYQYLVAAWNSWTLLQLIHSRRFLHQDTLDVLIFLFRSIFPCIIRDFSLDFRFRSGTTNSDIKFLPPEHVLIPEYLVQAMLDPVKYCFVVIKTRKYIFLLISAFL